MTIEKRLEDVVLELLEAHPEGLGPVEIASMAGSTPGSVNQLLRTMVAAGKVDKPRRGVYAAATDYEPDGSEPDEPNRRDEVRRVLEEAGGPLTLEKIREATGMTPGNAKNCVSEMTRAGQLVRVDHGIYDLPERQPEGARAPVAPPPEVLTIEDHILAVIREAGRISSAQIRRRVIEMAGTTEPTVRNALGDLHKAGRVQRVARGLYVLPGGASLKEAYRHIAYQLTDSDGKVQLEVEIRVRVGETKRQALNIFSRPGS